ncbi:MAG: ABC-2 type transport system ATP-binding protein [Arenicella sp.]|jgi:ABC-2 type transport system ATP-binding protein
MIRFDNFSFAYHKKFPIYTDLNLELAEGKIYGLFGKNGAGKSTLLKNITGTNRPVSGEVKVNDQTPHKRKPSFLGDLFMIPEEVYVPPINPKKFVKIYGSFYPKFSQEQFNEYIAMLEVPDTKNLTKLSFGQQKKFFIAFGLACNTRTVILDEPTNGLDIPSKSQFRKLMAKTIDDDKIFIISTHQVRDLDNILDHIIIVNQGKVLLNETIYGIEQKLAFNFYPSKPSAETALAIDEVIGGYAVMEENKNNEETNINLEQLFNTSIVNAQGVQQLFNS